MTEQVSGQTMNQTPGQVPAQPVALPSVLEIEAELNRVRHRNRFRRALRSTIGTLLVVAALAVLVACLWLPVLRVYGTSMTPTLQEGQIVVSVKDDKLQQGDVVGMYYGSKLLVKRCIATAGQWVDIDEDGNVSVDGVLLDEPYLFEKAKGECDIKLPYQVPDNSIFVMGDHRATSIDSRVKSVGCIDMDDVLGKIVFRIWPLKDFGSINSAKALDATSAAEAIPEDETDPLASFAPGDTDDSEAAGASKQTVTSNN